MARVRQRGRRADQAKRQHVRLPSPVADGLATLAKRRFTSVSALLRDLAMRELRSERIAV